MTLPSLNLGSRRILLVVPRPQRDLAGHALVAYHLEKEYGHDVVLCSGPDVTAKILEYAPDVLVLDFLGWDDRSEQARLAKRLGMKLVVLPTSGVYATSRAEVRAAGVNTGANALIDKFLSWGERGRNVLLREGVLTEDQAIAVGCPRFDFYREPLLSLVEAKARLVSVCGIRSPDRPLILWATTTNTFALPRGPVIRQQTVAGGVPKAEIRAWCTAEEAQFREHSTLVAELADRHTEWNVVVRVHPLEPVEPYLPLLEGRNNLYLATDGPFLDWLYYCDVLIQRGSTCAVEAWILRKPVLELGLPGCSYRFAPAEHESANEAVTGVEETETAIRRYLSGGSVPPAQQRARERLLEGFCRGADGRASRRCADEIARLVTPPEYTDEDQGRMRSATREARAFWQSSVQSRLANRVKALLGMQKHSSFRFWRKLRAPPRPSRATRATLDVSPLTMRSLFQTYENALHGAKHESVQAITSDE